MSSNNQNIIFCFLCGQQFKTPGGLARHNTIIKKYNKPSNNVKRIPKTVLKEFKQTLVFLIHQKLSNNFNHMGRQSLHIPCTESLFFGLFKGHIHYFKTNIYKCIFRGSNAYQALAKIFDFNEWGRRFYKQNQQTYIVIQENFQLPNKSNISMMQESEVDIDPLLQLVTTKSQKKPRKSKFTYGEVLVEWRYKKKIEEDGTVCIAGFMYIHFYIKQKRILT